MFSDHHYHHQQQEENPFTITTTNFNNQVEEEEVGDWMPCLSANCMEPHAYYKCVPTVNMEFLRRIKGELNTKPPSVAAAATEDLKSIHKLAVTAYTDADEEEQKKTTVKALPASKIQYPSSLLPVNVPAHAATAAVAGTDSTDSSGNDTTTAPAAAAAATDPISESDTTTTTINNDEEIPAHVKVCQLFVEAAKASDMAAKGLNSSLLFLNNLRNSRDASSASRTAKYNCITALPDPCVMKKLRGDGKANYEERTEIVNALPREEQIALVAALCAEEAGKAAAAAKGAELTARLALEEPSLSIHETETLEDAILNASFFRWADILEKRNATRSKGNNSSCDNENDAKKVSPNPHCRHLSYLSPPLSPLKHPQRPETAKQDAKKKVSSTPPRRQSPRKHPQPPETAAQKQVPSTPRRRRQSSRKHPQLPEVSSALPGRRQSPRKHPPPPGLVKQGPSASLSQKNLTSQAEEDTTTPGDHHSSSPSSNSSSSPDQPGKMPTKRRLCSSNTSCGPPKKKLKSQKKKKQLAKRKIPQVRRRQGMMCHLLRKVCALMRKLNVKN